MHRTATTIRVDKTRDGIVLHAHVIHQGEKLPEGEVMFHGIGASTISMNMDNEANHCRQAWYASVLVEDVAAQHGEHLTTHAEYVPDAGNGLAGSRSPDVVVVL